MKKRLLLLTVIPLGLGAAAFGGRPHPQPKPPLADVWCSGVTLTSPTPMTVTGAVNGRGTTATGKTVFIPSPKGTTGSLVWWTTINRKGTKPIHMGGGNWPCAPGP